MMTMTALNTLWVNLNQKYVIISWVFLRNFKLGVNICSNDNVHVFKSRTNSITLTSKWALKCSTISW